ncbi:MAG TPA: hypothetical protein VLB46_11845 [Pyrinomonadaceae bacterium]|nr:hypothetical protein [Pyrinomonadaceae bacterium]
MSNYNSDALECLGVVRPRRKIPFPAHIRNIKTNGFRGLNEYRMFVYLSEAFKGTAHVVYEPESFELKPCEDVRSSAYIPDFGIVFDEAQVLYVESKVCDVPLEEAQVKLSALSLTGRPCLLLVGYPRHFYMQLWVDGLGGKWVQINSNSTAAQLASMPVDFNRMAMQ